MERTEKVANEDPLYQSKGFEDDHIKIINSKKRITEIMREDPLYQSKGFLGVGRVLSGEDRERETPYRPGVTLDIESARLITQAYKETEGEPMVLRRAKAMAKLLDERTINIYTHERIVGNFASKPCALMTHPDEFWRWLDKEIDKGYGTLLTEKERDELHEIHNYWSNKAVHGMERKWLPEAVKPYWYYNKQGAIAWVHWAHTGVPNHEKVLKCGINGIIKEVKERLEEIESDPQIYLNTREYLEQKRFLKAALTGLEALVRFGKRFADKAREMEEAEQDEFRKRELQEIARICDWVPKNPPRNFHEALQSYWLVTLVTRLLDLQTSGLGDRFDQLMYPFYKRDRDAGLITTLEAQELVEHLFLKMNEEGQLVPPAQGASGGIFNVRMLNIGGQTPNGEDATNEMSYIVLDASRTVGLLQPQIAVRVHKKTPTDFLYKVIEVIRTRSGNFSFFNDEVKIPYLLGIGIPLEDARNYSIDGCVRWIIPGKALATRSLEGILSLPKCLEYALFQGKDKFTGKQMGFSTPDPTTFTSIENVIEAFLTQVKFFTEKLVIIANTVHVLEEEYLPQPLLSALLDGCIENGRDCRKYKYYPNTVIPPVGQVTVFNSLAAIKWLVFDQNKVSMKELLDALEKNWEGKESLRQMCIDAPKFGNDNDYVDLLGRDVQKRITRIVRSFKNVWGASYMEDGTGGSAYYNWSGLTGATPDGRKDRDLLNDGTISPYIGTDTKGPTAAIKSVSKIDHVGTFTHLFNQKIAPQYLDDQNKDRFVAYLRTFVDLGVNHVQFNIYDQEMLIDAQKHPEKHNNLVVKIAGYSSYFVDLGKAVQDQIISRTVQSLG